MSTIDYRSEAFMNALVKISETAGEAILEVYHREEGFKIESKEDDSPLTEADMRSNKVLTESLRAQFPEIPIISEELELAPFSERQHWPVYWIIDPLDGTKEFINRSGEFTVNVALVVNHQPVFGVVTAPFLDASYVGAEGVGAFKFIKGEKSEIKVRNLKARIQAEECVDVVASKRHGSDKVDVFLQKIESTIGKYDTKNIGSSLKICLLAEGAADFYPRLAPTCEWDIAAAHAVLKAAGGEIYHPNAEVFTYNDKPDILNDFFFAVADISFDWKSIICQSDS